MFKTNEQKVVVENRVKQGYTAYKTEQGDFLLTKGKHTMCINCLGYDTHVHGVTYKIKDGE